jgi:phospholipase/carboxylesterase
MNAEGRTGMSRELHTRAEELVSAQFIPRCYEPNYAYPLLVCFHARGADENQLVRVMPGLSWRNYLGLALRGPEPVYRRGQLAGFGWGATFGRTVGRGAVLPDAEVVRRSLAGESAHEDLERIEHSVFKGVMRARRALHIHSERIFLVGHGEGAAVAYRLGLTYPDRFAGIVALNGYIPSGFRPLARLAECRGLRILVVHGEWNGRTPVERARRDVAILRAGGLRVSYQTYPCGNRLAPRMLADVDTWLINQYTVGSD